MKSIRFILAIAAAFVAVVVGTSVFADEWKASSDPGHQFFDETFQISADTPLRLHLNDADVVIQEGTPARVQVFVKSSDKEKAREYYDEMRFEAGLMDKALRVDSRREWSGDWRFWDRYRHTQARVVVTMPRGADIRAKTGDGDVRVEAWNGPIMLVTSDGDIHVGALTGASITLKSSDGDITATAISGGIIELATSDGDILVESATGDELALSTSDGDIDVGASGEKLNASTSDGDITVTIDTPIALELRTHDGDVLIAAPKHLDAEVNLRGESVSIRGDVTIQGTVSRERVEGTIGNGGPAISARTSDGHVSLSLKG